MNEIPQGKHHNEPPLTRREFLRKAAIVGAGAVAGTCGFAGLFGPVVAAESGVREAEHYQRLPGGRVKCELCPWGCVTSDGQRGACRVRENRGGRYYTLVYGEAAALHIDPVEKKPLFHFHPGTKTLSVGTAGCNLRCRHCQNWEISQRTPEELRQENRLSPALPQALVSLAKSRGIPAIAFTYNEPVVFYEYMRETAVLAHLNGLRTVMISAGGINREPLLQLAPHLDAVKIDLKGFTDRFYRDYTSGRLDWAKTTIKRLVALGKWIEIVYLVIPSVNDSPSEIRQMAEWLKRAAGADVPLHFTRFYPTYRLKSLPPTPLDTLRSCRTIARAAGLKYVYVGNVPGSDLGSTHCPSCGRIVIARNGYTIAARDIKANGACRFCGTRISGFW